MEASATTTPPPSSTARDLINVAAATTSGPILEDTIEATSTATPDTRVNESYTAVFSNISNSLVPSFKWCPTSEQELAKAESDLLAKLKRPFKTYFVDIGQGWSKASNKIRTLEMSTDNESSSVGAKNDLDKDKSTSESKEKEKTLSQLKTTIDAIDKKQPLVLIHGFAAGIGIWILNLDALASSLGRKVYAIDVIGFARSSRAPFDLNGDVEGQFIDSIERWRTKVGLNKFILLGHSFGGYLSSGYAIRHPDRVSHLILADPWGIQDRQSAPARTYHFPIWVRAVRSIFQAFNPLAILRVSGPYGPSLLSKFRTDLREKYRPILEDDCDKFLNYIYHCNAQTATGESAFKSLALPYGWPKNPMIHRLVDLHESVSLTFIYGSRSWIDKAPGEMLREVLTPARVTVNEIEGSGHHVYADKYNLFNEMVREACSRVED